MPEIIHKRYALIMAGGKGIRMNSPVPKQFLKLDGKPVILHSINKFLDTDPNIDLILVLPQEYLKLWEALCAEYMFHNPIRIAYSGESRFHSVKNGLELVTEPSVVAIHDAVRPLVSSKTIQATYKAAEMYGNAVPAI